MLECNIFVKKKNEHFLFQLRVPVDLYHKLLRKLSQHFLFQLHVPVDLYHKLLRKLSY